VCVCVSWCACVSSCLCIFCYKYNKPPYKKLKRKTGTFAKIVLIRNFARCLPLQTN